MYQALYRKYRPANFNEVVGQEVIIDTLKNAVSNNKISHAYLFNGPRGTGKTSIAKIFAKTVNCTCLKETTPCDICVSCTQINNKQSTDIIEIDAASNNGVDEIREIRNKVNLVPSTGKYKVYIIDEVHMLTQGAFNALLKTLEEPPSHIIFILATTEPHKIPATILSRCQRFDFKRIPSDQIVSHLRKIATKESIEITDEALLTIANISDGGMRDSISLLDQVNSYKNGNITVDDIHKVNGSLSSKDKYEFIEQLFNKNLKEILSKIDEYNEDGKNLIKVIEEIINTLKEILMSKISISNINEINDKKINIIVQNINIEDLIEMINKFNNNLNEIKQANDSKLAIELLFIKECYNPLLSENSEKSIKKIDKKIEQKNKQENEVIEKSQNENNNEGNNNLEKENENLSKFEEKSFEKIQKIRIENTLSGFNKNEFKIIKDKLKSVEDFLTDEKYNKISSLIIDGELKAASTEYLLYVYDTDGSTNQFNSNILEIEKFLNTAMKMKYRVIAINKISWEIIKKEFNSKTKEYKYIPEDFDLKEFNKNKETENLNNFFESIIEYE